MRLRTVSGAGRAGARAGFTLMELLVVVAILLVLAGVATPIYLYYLEQSRPKVAESECVNLKGQLENFKALHGDYPPDNDWSLLPLEKKPPLDPWKRPYQWRRVEFLDPDGVTMRYVAVVWSVGSDGAEGTADDVSNNGPVAAAP